MDRAESTAASVPPELVFSFGTLLDEKVQQSIFGRRVKMFKDSLTGHGTTEIVITDPEVIAKSGKNIHLGLFRREGDTVSGGLLALTVDELAAADAYEVDAYARRRVRTTTRGRAWCYVSADPLDVAERIALLGDGSICEQRLQDGGWTRQIASLHINRNREDNRFFKLACPGATMDEILDAAETEVPALRADTVLVPVGIIDPLHAGRGIGEEKINSIIVRLGAFCGAMESQGRRVVIVGLNWAETSVISDLNLDEILELREILRSWCERTFRDFHDTWDVTVEQPALLHDDPPHPNAP